MHPPQHIDLRRRLTTIPPMPTHQPRLTAADEDRIHAGIDRFVELVRDVARITPGDGEDTPELADRLIAWWARKPDNARPSTDELTWAIGCAIGDFLYHVLEVWWEREPGGDPPAYSLTGHKRIKGIPHAIRIHPVEDIRARWSDDPRELEGIVTDYLDDLYEREEVRRFIAEGQG